MGTKRGIVVLTSLIVVMLAVTAGLLFGGRKAPVQRGEQPAQVSTVPAQPAGMLAEPTTPLPIPRQSQLLTLRDPFQGGPKPPPPPIVVHPDPEVSVYEISSATMTKMNYKPKTPAERARKAIEARYAGWVYNANGQVFALVEANGTARTLRVGDTLEGYTVTMIADDSLTLRAESGDALTLRLHDLGRGMTVDAAPGPVRPVNWAP